MYITSISETNGNEVRSHHGAKRRDFNIRCSLLFKIRRLLCVFICSISAPKASPDLIFCFASNTNLQAVLLTAHHNVSLSFKYS